MWIVEHRIIFCLLLYVAGFTQLSVSLSALMLFLDEVNGIRPVKSTAVTITESLLLGTSLTRSNSRKISRLSKKRVCVRD